MSESFLGYAIGKLYRYENQNTICVYRLLDTLHIRYKDDVIVK